jgi:tetratricopeptide (TPR) repeat protein
VSLDRDTLLSPWVLALLVTVLVAILIGFQPAKRFLDMDEPQTAGDRHAALLVAQAHVKANPERQDMRLELARLQLELQEPEAAGRTLAPLQDVRDAEVQWWLLEQKWQAMNALSGTGETSQRRRRDFHKQLQDIHESSGIGDVTPNVAAWSLSLSRLETLAGRWLAVERPERSAECFEALANRDDDRRPYWLSQAGHAWLQAGFPERAAAAWHRAWLASDNTKRDVTMHVVQWFMAAAYAGDDERRELARQSLTAAIQSEGESEGERSLAYAREYLAVYQDDPVLLDLGIRIALANDALDQALRWSERLLALDGQNPQSLERFTAIALAVGQPGLAIGSLQTLSRLQPQQTRYLEQLANVQRWTGNSAQALAALEKLARQTGDAAVDRQVVELALLSYDRQAALSALQRLDAGGALTAAGRGQLIDVLNDLGKPGAAIDKLRSWQTRSGLSVPLRVRLATLLEWVGELKASGQVWARLTATPGARQIKASEEQSRLLRRQWRLTEAIAALPEHDAGALARRGELGWVIGQTDEVVEAYRELSRRRPLTDTETQRLLQAARADQDIALVARMAENLWREDRDQEAIIFAFQAAQDQGRPDIAHRLLALAQQAPERFADSPTYWGFLGSTKLQQARPIEALNAYRQGLEVAPDSVNLRSGELYAMAQLGRPELRERLNDARTLAAHSQQLTLAMASGWESLGEIDKASLLFRRSLSGPRPAPTTLVSSAENFARTGREGVARKLRRHVLRTEAPTLARQLEPDHNLTEGELSAQLNALIWSLGETGAVASASWYQRLVTGTPALAAEPVEPGLQLLNVLSGMGQDARYRYLVRYRDEAGLPMPDFHALNLAIRQNDHEAIARLLDEPSAAFTPADRLTALQQLGRRKQAYDVAAGLQASGMDMRSDMASLRKRMPNRAGVSARSGELGDLSMNEFKASISRTGGRWGTELELGERQLDGDDLDLTVIDEGVDNERFAQVGAAYYGARSKAQANIGAVNSDTGSHPQAGVSYERDITSRFSVNAGIDWQKPAMTNDYLRLFAMQDSLSFGFSWQPTRRDRFILETRKSRFKDRFDGDDIGDGQRVASVWEHALVQGATRRVGLSLFASHDAQQADDNMPRALQPLLPTDATPEDLISDDTTFLGAGISVSRGVPGEAYPDVASPRWRLEFGAGHQWPSGDFAGSASVAVGSRVFGGDEISIDASIDQGTGADATTRVSAGIQYQIFLEP